MRSRFLEDLKVGDFVTTGSSVYEVTKVLKTQLEIEPYGQINRKGTSNSDARRITKKTGKLVGGFDTHFRSLYEDETPDGILEAFQSRKDKKAAEKAEREARAQARRQAAYEANSELEIEEIGMGVKKAVFVNAKGKKGMLIFTQTPDSTYDYEKREEVPAFRISSVVYSSRWLGEGLSFGMPGDVVATRTFDGIIELIASTYWD